MHTKQNEEVKTMKMTFGRFILRSVLYIVVMNAVLFILCALFDGDFDPTLSHIDGPK